MKINKKFLIIIIIIIIIFLAALFGLRFFNKINGNNNQQNLSPDVEKPITPRTFKNFSLATFFHRSDYICSVAMPEEWEGKYRQTDGGDTVYFYYIGNNKNDNLLFYIKHIDISEYKSNKDDYKDNKMEVLLNDKYAYISELNKTDSGLDNEYSIMLKEVDNIISTLKCTPVK